MTGHNIPVPSGSALLTTAIRTSALIDARTLTVELTTRLPLPWFLFVFAATTLVALVVTRLAVRRYIRFVACV